jgi:hypothetical protein
MQQIGCLDPESKKIMHKNKQELIKAGLDGDILDLSLEAPPLFERSDDWSSCCYFYLNSPENSLPELSSAKIRTAGLLEKK